MHGERFWKRRHTGGIHRSLIQDLKETDEIVKKRGDLIGRINNIAVTFPNAHDRVIRELFNSKAAHLYGCEAWDQTDPSIDKFYKAWNRGVRRLFHLPYDTHTRFLKEFTKTPHVKDQVLIRFYKMVQTMATSDNDRVSFLTRYMMVDARSIIGKNFSEISSHFNMELNYIKTGPKSLYFKQERNAADLQTVMMVQELRETLQGTLLLPRFGREEITDMITSLCSD